MGVAFVSKVWVVLPSVGGVAVVIVDSCSGDCN